MAKGLFETDALFWWIFDYMVFPTIRSCVKGKRKC